MNQKYEITQESIKVLDEKLFRIKALIDIACYGVKAGDLGGYIKSEANLTVYDNAWVYDNAFVYGDARVSGNARVYASAHIKFGLLQSDIYKDWAAYIASSLNVYPIKGYYTLYKRVNKISDGKYAACYDSNCVYQDGKITRVDDFDPDINVSCSRGIHASTPFYYSKGDTLIAVKIKASDIITCQEGKVRCKALTTIGEVS